MDLVGFELDLIVSQCCEIATYYHILKIISSAGLSLLRWTLSFNGVLCTNLFTTKVVVACFDP